MKRLISILLLFIYLPLSYSTGVQAAATYCGSSLQLDVENTGGKEEERTGTETISNEQVQQQLKLVKKTQSTAAATIVVRNEAGIVGETIGRISRPVILPQAPLYIWHCVYRL
ncbi:hypothetical protein MKQ70_00735 [Chitinophaga sedimenti]|uniref:hypothetical protein n=1 Tax=Chitinophaga sedimenti TaxID=2033606 RepID=UPI002005D29B|nr:hypothetical protein [Chitinophaga sedimenti]MCK7553607.1 hypothetical protein [Chitinophaga sedimenti]